MKPELEWLDIEEPDVEIDFDIVKQLHPSSKEVSPHDLGLRALVEDPGPLVVETWRTDRRRKPRARRRGTKRRSRVHLST